MANKSKTSPTNVSNLRFDYTLTGDFNWIIWKEQLIHFLSSNNLNGIIDNRDEGQSKKDLTCQRILKQACSLPIQDLLSNCKTSCEMWKILERKFEFKYETFDDKVNLRKELSNCKLTGLDKDKLEKWLTKMLSIYTRIIESESQISCEKEFLYFLIGKVQEKGDFLFYLDQNQESDSPLTIQNFFDLIQTYCNEVGDDENEKLLSKYTPPCLLCHHHSHALFECWYNSENWKEEEEDDDEPKPNKDKIKKKKKNSKNPKPDASGDNNLAVKPKVEEFCNLLVAFEPGEPDPVSRDCWVMLELSTNHFCVNKNFMTNLRRIDPVTVKTYTGSITLDTIGEVILESDSHKYVFTAYYTPNSCTNVIGVQKLIQDFDDVKITFFRKKNMLHFTVSNDDDLLIEAFRTNAPHMIRNLKPFNFLQNISNNN